MSKIISQMQELHGHQKDRHSR